MTSFAIPRLAISGDAGIISTGAAPARDGVIDERSEISFGAVFHDDRGILWTELVVDELHDVNVVQATQYPDFDAGQIQHRSMSFESNLLDRHQLHGFQ